MASKLVETIVQGTALDRIKMHYRYGEVKVPLSEEDEVYLQKIEWIRDMWLEHKEEADVIPLVLSKYPDISKRQVYNWIADAKTLWAFSQNFNYTFELANFKSWIDKAYKLGSAGSGDPKMMKAALDAMPVWMELARKDAERNRPEEEKNLTFIFNMDFTQWMTNEQYEAAKAELEEIKQKARKKFKDFEDAEYIELNK